MNLPQKGYTAFQGIGRNDIQQIQDSQLNGLQIPGLPPAGWGEHYEQGH